jgi:HK97 family phage major capsid protein
MAEQAKTKTIATLQGMREAAAQKLTEAEELQAGIDAEDRAWTEEEEAHYNDLVSEASDLKKDYEFEQRRMQTEARRQAAASVRQDFNSIPTPQDVLTRGVNARVTRMKANWTEDPQWEFRGHGDFAMAVYQQAVNGMVDDRLSRILGFQAAMDHNTPQTGGFLMPPVFNRNIYTHMMGSRINLMAMCDLYPIIGAISIEFTANAETSRVPGSRWGGISSAWVEDGTAMTDSQPKVRNLELRPRQLATFVKVNNTLLQNADTLEAYLDRAAVDDQIQTINNAILRGDGVAKPKGFFTGSSGGSFVSIAKESGQAANTIVDDNVHKMWARCLDEENAIWLINRDAVPELDALAATGVSGTIPVMLANVNGYPTMAVPGPQMLKGRPTRRLEQCATLGTQGDIVLANMSGYAMAYRARGDAGTVDGEPGIQKDMSMHLEFDKNRICFRYIIAVNGEAWLQTAITPEQGTSVLSHFIVLDTRA